MKRSVADRFWDKVVLIPEHACWEWVGYRNHDGYGRMYVDGRDVMAHRISFEINRAKIPADLLVCHRCDNPSCVNPAHLWLGTERDNTLDAVSKGRWPLRKSCFVVGHTVRPKNHRIKAARLRAGFALDAKDNL